MCAWTVDKETKDIVFTFPGGEGMAPDPYSGINKYFGVNLSVPGEVSVGYPMSNNATSGGTLGVPIADSTRWWSYTASGAFSGATAGTPQSFAILDATGNVWEATSITGTWTLLSSGASTTGASSSDGLAYFLGRLFKTRGANIDYWNGSTWTNAWQTTLTGSCIHFMYVGTDNVLYITNNNYLASISPTSVTTFDPSSGGTFTFSITKLQLPVTDTAISLAEVGQGSAGNSMLLVGGVQNAIYPWDKTSTSFNLPINVGDSYIRNMVSVNQNVFIFPGNNQGRGRIYITNGSQAEEYFKIPDYVFGQIDPYYQFGDAIFHRNHLLWGMYVNPNSGSSPLNFAEVYALNLETKAFYTVASVGSQLVGNATCLISTSNLSSPGFGFIAGWTDSGAGTNTGIQYSGTTAGTGSAVIQTDLVPVGTFLNKRTFTQVEIKFRNALQSGESALVIPVPDGSSGSTLTFSPGLSNGTLAAVAPVNFQASQWLKFQIQLTGASATGGCQLHELRLR